MPRPRTLLLSVAAAVVLVLTALLVALPTIVRRVAVDQLTRMTGRAVTLERVELNLFTGRVALGKFRLAQRASNDPALEVEGLEARVALLSALGRHLRVPSVTLTNPRIAVARLTPTEFDFSDLLELVPPADPNAPPSTRTVSIERLTISGGAMTVRDDVTASVWRLDGLAVDGAALSTRGEAPGRLTVRATLNGTPLALDAGAVDLAKGTVLARATLEGFDVGLARPYVPAALGFTPTTGRVSMALDIKAEKATPAPRVTVAGTIRVDGFGAQLAGVDAPFVTVGRVLIALKDAQPLAGTIALDTIAVDDADVTVTRDAQGRIDVLALVQRPAAAPSPAALTPSASPASAAAPAAMTVTLRELALRGARVTMRDETVGATLALTDLSATVRDVAWPGGSPLSFDLATALPGAGRLQVKGTATLAPITADIAMSMRGATIAPYQPYMPIPGRLTGVVHGESRSRVTLTDGAWKVASQGKSSIENLELRAPGGGDAPVKVVRIAIDGVEFAYPERAAAKRVTITRPELRVERDANGEITIRRLFAAETPPITTTRTPAPVTPVLAAPTADDHALVLTVPMPLEIGAFVIEDGYARFVDRTTTPAFSETLSRLAVRIDGLSSEPGRRATVAVQAIVGGNSALDLKGQVALFGDLYADVAGELRGFALPTVNPYADSAIAWIVERGTLAMKLHYTVERNQLTARNEIIVENLHVARSRSEDEVQKRIGLPLGLIVALITDANNGIRVNLPLGGSLQNFQADISDAIWTAVKNVVVNVVAAPFKAIGRLFTGSTNTIEALAIDPATFAPGSADIAGTAEAHVTKVADFLRRSPALTLTLAPVTTPADAESLRAQELAARLQRVQRAEKLETLARAVAMEFARVFPGEPAPKTTDERLARLREREPMPEPAVAELAARRLIVVREALAQHEGIAPARLVAGAAAVATDGAGRVEFKIGD